MGIGASHAVSSIGRDAATTAGAWWNVRMEGRLDEAEKAEKECLVRERKLSSRVADLENAVKHPAKTVRRTSRR